MPYPALEEGQSNDKRHQLCVEYAESMPGAVNLKLKPGDFCLYRNTLWHMGVYHPETIRATIHDGKMTEGFNEWMEGAQSDLADRRCLSFSAFLLKFPLIHGGL